MRCEIFIIPIQIGVQSVFFSSVSWPLQWDVVFTYLTVLGIKAYWTKLIMTSGVLNITVSYVPLRGEKKLPKYTFSNVLLASILFFKQFEVHVTGWRIPSSLLRWLPYKKLKSQIAK